jgi:hypothetical protein
MGHGNTDGNLPFYFFRRVIAYSFAGFKGFRLWDNPAGEKQALKEGGFACASVSSDSDIFDKISGITHGNSL